MYFMGITVVFSSCFVLSSFSVARFRRVVQCLDDAVAKILVEDSLRTMKSSQTRLQHIIAKKGFKQILLDRNNMAKNILHYRPEAKQASLRVRPNRIVSITSLALKGHVKRYILCLEKEKFQNIF